MKKLLIVPFLLSGILSFGQAAWIDPDPANVAADVKLMVDVSHPDCGCPLLEGADLAGDSLYIWTWTPGDPPGGNGQWNASNLALQMTSEGDDIWSFTMTPTSFYGVEASAIYDGGIEFLAKKYDGSAVDGGEPKSVDFHVFVEAPGCLNTLCSFPSVFQEDDYLTMIYNNNLETHPGLQNIEADDCYMLPVAVAGGIEYPYYDGSVSDPGVLDRPELHMKYEGEGRFYTTILSDDFFRINSDNPVPDGVPIEMIKVRYRKSVFTGNVSSPYELELQCD